MRARLPSNWRLPTFGLKLVGKHSLPECNWDGLRSQPSRRIIALATVSYLKNKFLAGRGGMWRVFKAIQVIGLQHYDKLKSYISARGGRCKEPVDVFYRDIMCYHSCVCGTFFLFLGRPAKIKVNLLISPTKNKPRTGENSITVQVDYLDTEVAFDCSEATRRSGEARSV